MIVGAVIAVAADQAFFLSHVFGQHPAHIGSAARIEMSERLKSVADIFRMLRHVNAQHLEIEFARRQRQEHGMLLGMPGVADRGDARGNVAARPGFQY